MVAEHVAFLPPPPPLSAYKMGRAAERTGQTCQISIYLPFGPDQFKSNRIV
jgi:hypothetical protein